MSDVAVGGLIGLGGVVLGFVLNALWEWWRFWQNDEKRRDSVRELVQLEMERNIVALDRFCAGVTEPSFPPDHVYEDDEFEFIKRRRLVETPLAPWSRLMWESQAGQLADAIPDRYKLSRTYELNKRLDEFSISRESIHVAFDTDLGKSVIREFNAWTWMQREPPEHYDIATRDLEFPRLGADLREFNRRTGLYWATCMSICSGVVSEGNPLD